MVNSAGIILTADLGFLIFGFWPRPKQNERQVFNHVQIVKGAAVLLVLAIPVLATLRRVVLQQHTRAEIQEILHPILRTKGASLVEFQFFDFTSRLEISPVIRTAQYLGEEELERIKQELQAGVGRPVQLNFKQVLQLETGDPVTGGMVRQEASDYHENLSSRGLEDLHGASQEALNSALSNLSFGPGRKGGSGCPGAGPTSSNPLEASFRPQVKLRRQGDSDALRFTESRDVGSGLNYHPAHRDTLQRLVGPFPFIQL